MIAGSVWVDGRLSLQHYAELAWDERQLGLAKNSLGLALGTTVLSLIIGLPLALIIEKTDIWGQKILRMLYIIPLLIPPYMHAIVWSHLFGNNGIVNRLLMTCLGATSPLLNIYSLPGAVFVMTMAYFPIITLMTMSGLKGIDKCQEEAGWIHGNVIQTILRISLPLATPYIFCGALFVFVFAIINFGVPDILRLRVYPLEVFIQFGALFQEGIAMALSLPLVLLTFLIVYFQKRYMDKRSYVNFGGGYNPAAPYQLGVRQWIFPWFAILVVIVSGAIPIVVLLKMAGPLSTYVRVLQSSIDQLIYSTLMGLAGAACMTILSFLMAFYCSIDIGKFET